MADPRQPLLSALLLLALAGAGPTVAQEGAVPEATAGDSAQAAAGEQETAVEAGDEGEAPPPLWMETYSEGVYSRHEGDNASGFADVILGKRFRAGVPVDVYAKARMHRDARDFFWNNHLDAGLGARATWQKGFGLRVFAEALAGQYYRTSAGVGDMAGLQARLDRTRGSLDAVQTRFQGVQVSIFRRAILDDTVFSKQALDSLDALLTAQGVTLEGLNAYLDSLETTRDSLRQVADSLARIPAGPLSEYRAGFVFWYGRGQEPPEGGPRPAFPFRFWCDIYADGIYSSLRRTVQSRRPDDTYADSAVRFDNFILYANPDVGVMLMDGPGGSLAAYATAYAWFDTRGDWWNNRFMAGPGLRLRPLRAFDLVFALEHLWGAYYGRERDDDPNPYARTFSDLRLQASFWYGLGF